MTVKWILSIIRRPTSFPRYPIMRPAKYLLVPAILCMPIPANLQAASISAVLAAKEFPMTLLLVVVNGSAIEETPSTPHLDKRYDGFLNLGSALDMLLKAGFDMRSVGRPGGGGGIPSGATGAVGANGSGGGSGGEGSATHMHKDIQVGRPITSPNIV
jgi:hypothetical protein